MTLKTINKPTPGRHVIKQPIETSDYGNDTRWWALSFYSFFHGSDLPSNDSGKYDSHGGYDYGGEIDSTGFGNSDGGGGADGD